MPKQPPTPPSLPDLIAQAEDYANFSMRQFGRVPPTLFLAGADGTMVFMPKSLEDDRAKDDFATMCRLTCIAHGATICVMALEAWAKFAKPDEKLDMTERPSEAFDRQEIVMLTGEAPGVQLQKFLPIVRSGNGKFFGFGEPNILETDKAQGRFAQILPPQAPDEATREIAKTMLKLQGLPPAKSTATRPPRRFG